MVLATSNTHDWLLQHGANFVVWEVWSSNPVLASSYTALQTVRHRFNIYASKCVALALWRGDGHRKLVRRYSASIIKSLILVV